MRNLVGMAGTALALVMTSPAYAWVQPDPEAEASAPDEAAGGEIVVTAQKRSQSLIEVPQSISVVTAATLERQGATNFTDYLRNVPSLQLVQSTPGEGRLVLRGINTGGVASTVAVYVDETPFGSSTALANGAVLAGDFDSFDVARIEVLRGPQGTLYGASSLGGLLKFVTNAPSVDGFEGRALAGIEFTEGGDVSYRGAAMVNVPLGDTLAFRASGFYRRQGGYIDSIGTAGSNVRSDINDFQSYGGRASLLWQPDPDLTVRLTALLQNLYVDAPGIVESDPATLRPLFGGLTHSEYIPAFSNVRYRLYNGTIEYDFGPATLTSSTSYGEQLQSFRADYTANLSAALGGPYVYFDQQTPNRKWTQELRLASDGGAFVEWLVGGYYTRERARIAQRLALAVPGTPGTLTPIDLPAELALFRLDSLYEEIAGFANATFHLAAWLDLDLGGRYSHNRQRADQTTDGALLGSSVINNVRSSDNVFTYSIAPRFILGPRASIYGRVAKGYRPGGPNVIPIAAPPGTPLTFEPDTVTSYEIGFKGDTADRRVSLELSLYHIDWSNIQLFAVVNGFGVNVNGGGAEVDGAELAATFRPIPGLVASLNLAINDARLTSDADPVVVGAVRGDRLPFTPRYAVSLNADYQWRLGGEVTASVGGSLRTLSRQSGSYDPAYLAAFGRFPDVRAYQLVDLRAGLSFGRYAINAYVNNLTDSGGIIATQPLLGVAGLPREVNGAIGTGIVRPRTIGVNLTVGF